MKTRQRQAIILSLLEAMHKYGSWCGETHIQKATYFLEEMCNVPLELEFILYKHGPFSFNLRDELTSMRADSFIKLVAQYPYGPSLTATETAQQLITNWPKTIIKYNKCVDFVAKQLGPKGVVELEQLGTALYVTKEKPGLNADERAKRMHELKHHISDGEALIAVNTIDDMFQRFSEI